MSNNTNATYLIVEFCLRVAFNAFVSGSQSVRVSPNATANTEPSSAKSAAPAGVLR